MPISTYLTVIVESFRIRAFEVLLNSKLHFCTFALIAWGEEMTPEASLERCRGEFLTDSEIRDIRGCADIFAKKYDPAKIKEFAVEVAEAMAPFQVVMEKLGTVGRGIAGERGLG